MTVLKGIDISSWQKGFDLADAKPDFAIVKATEGLGWVDKYCDGFVQDALRLNIPFGYYHFALSNDPVKEATFFYDNTKNYVGKGIPILDFEVPNGNDWLETWCRTFCQLSGVRPWVYMNSDYINNRGYGTSWVKSNCGLWLAGYPKSYTDYPNVDCPYAHTGWTLAAWQFTSSLAMGGMSIDGDYFYGDRKAWNAYVGIDGTGDSSDGMVPGPTLLELATDVIKGRYGNGIARRNALGSRYDEVQAKINDLYAKANKAIKGRYGNGADRRNALGDEYGIVQYIVNNMLK
jgi:lysozyme